MPCLNINVDKINHLAEADPVDGVADRTTGDQPRAQPFTGPEPRRLPDHPGGHGKSQKRQQERHRAAAVRQHAEADPGIPDRHKIQEGQDFDALRRVEHPAKHHLLRRKVGDQHRQRDEYHTAAQQARPDVILRLHSPHHRSGCRYRPRSSPPA